MSITAQGGIFAVGINAAGAKGGAVATWHNFRVLSAGLAPNVPATVAPPEIGGPNNPTGAYKTNTWFGGRVSLQPRLLDDFGWLLLSATGASATAVDTPVTGVNQHVFSQEVTANGGALFIPFMGVRRVIPGLTGQRVGELGKDCIVAAMTFNFPQTGPVSADLDFTGLDWELFDDAAVASWTGATENYDTVPMTMKGNGITLPNWVPGGGTTIPATSARITIANNTTTPQEEFIIGSFFPDDYATRQRSLIVEFTYKWANPDLYRFIINGNAANGLFENCLEFTDLILEVEAPCDIDPGTIDAPEVLRIKSDKIFWQFQPVQLAGDDLVMLQVTGQAVENPSGAPEDYYTIELENTATAYAMPA